MTTIHLNAVIEVVDDDTTDLDQLKDDLRSRPHGVLTIAGYAFDAVVEVIELS